MRNGKIGVNSFEVRKGDSFMQSPRDSEFWPQLLEKVGGVDATMKSLGKQMESFDDKLDRVTENVGKLGTQVTRIETTLSGYAQLQADVDELKREQKDKKDQKIKKDASYASLRRWSGTIVAIIAGVCAVGYEVFNSFVKK